MEIQNRIENRLTSFLPRIPLAVWVLAVLVGILIPLKILSLGYIPIDDAKCHVAKAISDKAWPEILVMDERFAEDEHPGWHIMLGALHRYLNCDADTLIFFSIAGPFAVFWLIMLRGRRRPEAVLLALMAGSLLSPPSFTRLLNGRPLIVMMVVYLVLVQMWMRKEKMPPWKIGLSVLLIGFSVWVHGSWYLFGFMVAGFALANEWRKAWMLGACWLAGVLFGAILTGHPFGYLQETTVHLFNCFSGNLSDRMLVTELRAQYTDFFFVIILLALLWRVARGDWQSLKVWTPLLVLAVLGWVLGFKVWRFWNDWGFPAAMLWLAKELEEVLQANWESKSWKTLGLAVLAAAGVYFSSTGDINSRWSSNLTNECVTSETPGIAGWLPDKDGIVYLSDMQLFFSMFYKNPKADWRYALGFEPGVMTPENYEIYRKIQWKGSAKFLDLWAAKMRPEDRMILLQDSQPPLPRLEWHYATDITWIGRLPRTNAVSKIKP